MVFRWTSGVKRLLAWRYEGALISRVTRVGSAISQLASFPLSVCVYQEASGCQWRVSEIFRHRHASPPSSPTPSAPPPPRRLMPHHLRTSADSIASTEVTPPSWGARWARCRGERGRELQGARRSCAWSRAIVMPMRDEPLIRSFCGLHRSPQANGAYTSLGCGIAVRNAECRRRHSRILMGTFSYTLV